MNALFELAAIAGAALVVGFCFALGVLTACRMLPIKIAYNTTTNVHFADSPTVKVRVEP